MAHAPHDRLDKAPAAPRAAAPAKTKKSARRREEILQRAAELFDRQGYANTSLDDVARAIGIKREALYYYYRNRAEILLAIIGPQSVALIEGLRAIMATPATPVEKLHGAMRNHLERFDRYCLEMTVSLRDGLLEATPEVRREMTRIWKDYERMWTALIAAGQASGAFTRGGDAKMIAFGILGMCNWLARWYDPRKQVSIDVLIRTYFDLIASGLVAPERRERAGAKARRRQVASSAISPRS
jgi:AcrR family transcriptional regulator